MSLKQQGKKENRVQFGKMRMENLELLRCLAMMMVVALHYLGKGNLLPELIGEHMGGAGLAAWALEAFCIVAVNVYMMISGYFLSTSSFKISRLIKLYLQVWVYSVGFGVLAAMTGILPAAEVDIHYYLSLLFPVSMGHYWFMTAYVFLYLLLPLIGAGVRRLSKEQLQITIGLLLLAFCLLKTILPVRLEEDGQGYDCLWYVCVFVVAAYIRRFGAGWLEHKGRAAVLYVLGCFGVFAELFVLRFVYLRTGSLDRILKISLEYNHLFPFLAALGVFGLFLQIKVPGRLGTMAVKIAPYTLGVYLLHENMGLRYAWQNWLGADKITSAGGVLLGTLLAVACVFVCGVLVDMVRARIISRLHGLLGKFKIYDRLIRKIETMDELFLTKKEEM